MTLQSWKLLKTGVAMMAKVLMKAVMKVGMEVAMAEMVVIYSP
jgi:hypothetical protein